MKKTLLSMPRWAALALISVLATSMLTGCASSPNRHTSRAPVEDRTRPGTQTPRVTTGNTATTASDGYHIVKPGDTLYSIARTYGVAVSSIVSSNQLADANQINVGQRLRIPGQGSRTVIVDNSNTGDTVTTTPIKQDDPKPTTTTTAAVGTWVWPVQGGKVVTNFGSNGAKGIEISAPLGTPVLAADAGKVIFSNNNIRGYGNLIVIRHDSNYLTAYGYNSRLLVKEGDVVKRGDKIAEVGSSGTTVPKLHFEIRNTQSKPVDPLLHLPKQ